MNIYMVRHGQDDETVRGGWCNHGLIEEGIKQSEELGKKLANISFDKIYSSDLTRAVETTKIVLKELTTKLDVRYTDELREINNGLLSGMKHEVAEEKYPGLYYRALKFDEKYPLGESPKEFYKRIEAFWRTELVSLDAENVLIVTHGGVINIMLHIFDELPYSNKETPFSVGTGTFVKIEI